MIDANLAYYMDKKRIRGLKRHLRNHRQWATVPEPFNEKVIQQSHYDYEKLGLAPWRVNEKPPVTIRKLWVSRLVTDFQEWHGKLESVCSDFYLAVWIFDPDFGESQLVAAIEDRKSRYDGVFGETLDMPLPREYHALSGVQELRWSAKANITFYWPEDFAELGSWALTKPHWPVEGTDGEPLIAVQLGVVWVGQKAS